MWEKYLEQAREFWSDYWSPAGPLDYDDIPFALAKFAESVEAPKSTNLWLKLFCLFIVLATLWTLWRMEQGPALVPAVRIETVQIVDKSTGQPVSQGDYDYLQKDLEGMRESYDLTLTDYRNLKAIADAIRNDWKAARGLETLTFWDAKNSEAVHKHFHDLDLLINQFNEEDAEPFRYPEFDKNRRVVK